MLTLLCSIALVGMLEVFKDGTLEEKLLDVLLFIAGAAIGLWALRRYLHLLVHAEEVANQANCPYCGTYARFAVVSEDRRSGQATVCCRQCQTQWTIEAQSPL